jgi:predicted PhzF superfamily epimerase YddE/YHI9
MASGSTFSPDQPCTRASTVTFLWKAAGSPNVSSARHFTDVPTGSAYAAAVAWAVETGVTNGTTATTFAPGNTVTRGEAVTFLYRGLAE